MSDGLRKALEETTVETGRPRHALEDFRREVTMMVRVLARKGAGGDQIQDIF